MYDSQIFCHQRFGGVSRYFSCLANELAHFHDVTPLIVAPVHINEYLIASPPSIVFGKQIPMLERLPELSYVFGALPSMAVAKRFSPHIVHNTYYLPIKPSSGSKLVITVHDLIHEKFPEDSSPSSSLVLRWKRKSIKMADHVICVSENTRRDLLNHYQIDESKVSVAHHGYGTMTPIWDTTSSKALERTHRHPGSPYILFVGGRQGYKNFSCLLTAFASSQWLRKNFILLCFGGGPFSSSEQQLIADLQVGACLRQIGGSDQTLAGCYANAALFVFPSRYEGFGIPPLEAMSLDCPVACSDTSSLPEVVGNAAKTFSPHHPDSIRIAMESVLSSDTETKRLVDLGRVRRRLFSWRRCAEATVAAYRQVLS